MQTKIIIITGKAQSGKDTAASYIQEKLINNNKTVGIYPLAEELKAICSNLFGLSGVQCWGSNSDKDTDTNIKWRDLPLCGCKIGKLMVGKYPKTGDDFMTARELMQILGTDVFRKIDKNCWARAVMNKINLENKDFAIISDARFPNELDFFKDSKPIIIRLTRDLLKNTHESEIALDNYNFSDIKNLFTISNEEMSMEEKNKHIDLILKQYL